MKAAQKTKRWEKTRLQNLVRNEASGRYYARLYLGGKEVWKSLKTSHFSVAESRLAAIRKEHREHRRDEIDPANAKMTFGQAAKLHMQRLEKDVRLKRLTRLYWQVTNAALLKSWPGVEDQEVRRVTPVACREWAAQFAKSFSSTRYNGALSHLRRIFDLAIENGVLHNNPAVGLKRRRVPPKQLELPTREQFAEFIEEMKAGHSRDSNNCADFAQGLAFTGCRISEAAQIVWRDLDFVTGEILVRGRSRRSNQEWRNTPRADDSNRSRIVCANETTKA